MTQALNLANLANSVNSSGQLAGSAVNGAVASATNATNATNLTGGTCTIGTTQLGAGDASIMKNRIINGAMVIDQRNAGASITNNSATFAWGVDRMIVYGTQTSKFTSQQNAGSVTPPVGFTNYLGITSLSAYSITSTDWFAVSQRIEGFNTADLQWGTANAKTVTLSFQVYSSLTGTFGGVLTNSAQNRSYPFTYTVSSVNTWTSISITVAGDTTGTWVGATNGTGIAVVWGLGVGSTLSGTAGSWAGANYYSATGATSVVGTSGATFYITGVQLEVGSSATGYEYVNYQTSLANCQRYFSRWDSTNNTYTPFIPITYSYAPSTIAQGTYFHPVSMRSAPTITSSAIGTFNTSFTVLTLSAIQGFTGIDKNVSSIAFTTAVSTLGYTAIVTANGVTTAFINFSAEL